ncbi:MAG: hypothetical protein WAM78_07160 [Candidatus Sulfotelmatobacter sp.]
MATRQGIYFLLPAAMLLLMAGCSSSGSTSVKNQTAPAATPVTIAFKPAPPAAVAINATATLTAVVTNDSSNSGVDWSLECALPAAGTSSPCGSLSAPHTASGTAVTYTPPTAFPGSSLPVTILAFATAAHTQNVVAGLVVTGFTAMLKGTYVLQAQGMDSAFNPYQFAGVVVLDGKGNIASGEQILNFFDPNVGTSGAYLSKPDAITGGSYFLGIDGRGTLNINTTDQDLGANGTELFNFVFLSSSQTLITALPTSTLSIAATGTMDLQTSSVTAPTAGYAFVVSGTDLFQAVPTAFGGIFNIDSPNVISGNGSVGDQNIAGSITDSATVTGTVSNPDPYGAVTISLNIPLFSSGLYTFTGYIVDATHIKLIESDTGGIGSTIGLAIGQGSATGTFTGDSVFSGTYVFGVPGQDLTFGTYFPASATSVGVFTADGAGNITNAITDTFLQANQAEGTAGTQISASFGGVYTVTHPGDGHVRAAFNHFVPEPTGSFAPLFFLFLTGNGNPALVLASGDINYGFLGAGIAYPQAAAPLTFGGTYGVDVVQQNGLLFNAGEGPMTATASTGTLSGLLDFDANFLPSLDAPFTGTFAAAPDANGRSAGTFTGPFVFSPFAAEYYAIDSGHGFFVETDLTNVIAPTGTVSLGYYTPRTPACSGCQ